MFKLLIKNIMYKADEIIVAIGKAKNTFERYSIAYTYYEILYNQCIYEAKNKKEVRDAKVSILHYFMFYLPTGGKGEFECIYNPYHHVRYACEKFAEQTKFKLTQPF